MLACFVCTFTFWLTWQSSCQMDGICSPRHLPHARTSRVQLWIEGLESSSANLTVHTNPWYLQLLIICLGGLCNGEGSSLPTGAIQNQCCTEDDGIDSWFSAALWSFVESIPIIPASTSGKNLEISCMSDDKLLDNLEKDQVHQCMLPFTKN